MDRPFREALKVPTYLVVFLGLIGIVVQLFAIFFIQERANERRYQAILAVYNQNAVVQARLEKAEAEFKARFRRAAAEQQEALILLRVFGKRVGVTDDELREAGVTP